MSVNSRRLIVCAAFSIAAAGYLLLAGTLVITEVATALVFGSLGAAGVLVLAAVSNIRFNFSSHHLPIWLRAVADLPKATFYVGAALFAVLRSQRSTAGAHIVPFRAGRATEPHERARRATALLAASLAPDSFVIDLQLRRNAALMHAITEAEPEPNPEWLA